MPTYTFCSGGNPKNRKRTSHLARRLKPPTASPRSLYGVFRLRAGPKGIGMKTICNQSQRGDSRREPWIGCCQLVPSSGWWVLQIY
jgi:hypothetical protein